MAFTLVYTRLPPEIRREIDIWACLMLKETLVEAIKRRTIEGPLPAALYAFTAIKTAAHFGSFLTSLPTAPTIGSAVVNLAIDGSNHWSHMDWNRLVSARKHLHRLKSIKLRRVVVGEHGMVALASGLEHFVLVGCRVTSSSLLLAVGHVRSFVGKGNDIIISSEGGEGTFALTRLLLVAMSEQESNFYCTLLARVEWVECLIVRGIQKGWVLGGSWSTVKYFTCLFGLPRYPIDLSTAAFVSLGTSDNCLDVALAYIPRQTTARLVVGVDVAVGTSPDCFWPLWSALDLCSSAVSICVVFHLRGRSIQEAMLEEADGYHLKLCASNVVEGEELCARAMVDVCFNESSTFYRSE
ncbi:hypothetical protein CYLTODRAFT_489606 [Cylindrobasidium torrendii FP15055 ss-10]|uniref:F-box domain-containing protein n=1 Tax=Cylindrobasidium torrendii FP15055 ss-10 TaxID=1314674 RepID=A0A0D7BEH7_9AGAR|nr:hypothetical protein CYLTODRAFT_489606 [Cylindrobasidium torrendii FP15055 ss-10]